MKKLKIYEIFLTVNGEAGLIPQGSWTVFVRLSKCPLRCSYCDTPWTWGEGKGFDMNVRQIVAKVKELSKGTRNVVITGGEPLEQVEALCGADGLFWALSLEGFSISVETCGAKDIPLSVPVSCWVIDYKLPESAEESKMLPMKWFARQLYKTRNILKFVICSRGDYERAKEVVAEIKELWKKCDYNPLGEEKFAFSPVVGLFEPVQLFEAMKQDGIMDIRMNLQIHALGKLKEGSSAYREQDLGLCTSCGKPHRLNDEDAGTERERQRMCRQCLPE